MFLAELAGREAEMALEHLGEVVHIADAAVLGYRLHLQLGVPQEIGGGVHPHIGDILCHRLARLLMKQGGEIPRADIEDAGKVLQVKVGGGLGLDVGHRLLHSSTESILPEIISCSRLILLSSRQQPQTEI